MKYNSSLDKLIIPEYGRNVQRLINHAKTIEDSEERQAFVERVVDLMAQMHPQTRNVEDYHKKIWGHVFRIAEYDIDVTPPEGVSNTPEQARSGPAKVPYPQIKTRFRHYGKNVHTMISKAIAMEDEEKKAEFSEVIAAYMKMAFKTWNREIVSDEQIAADLVNLSDGQLSIAEDTNIDGLLQPARKRNNNNNHKKNNNRNYGNNNRKNFKNNKHRKRY
ncbi:MAG: DUF4290 domain-containing protein [Bacteroidota bacterium]